MIGDIKRFSPRTRGAIKRIMRRCYIENQMPVAEIADVFGCSILLTRRFVEEARGLLPLNYLMKGSYFANKTFPFSA